MEDNELHMLLKELVDRVKILEVENASLKQTVYNADNVLMKSGLVKINSPVPILKTKTGIPDGETIAKMDWEQIDDLVHKIQGE
jgi:hypothetical protein|tara:strand:+ start:231 stop:482 length:252 start_codon:yes stop_codon:yes gene_type:complete